MKILKVPISSVVPWDKNPRGIKTKDYERLKKQILKLGVYKPLVCYQDGKKYVVLGGNMRIRALQELGVREIEISLVTPKTEAEKIEFSLSDNDRVGFYEEQALAELILPRVNEIDVDSFMVDMDDPAKLRDVLKNCGPDVSEDEPELQISPELLESHNYVVLYFDNEVDWLAAKQIFGLKTVKGFDSMGLAGVGRVIPGAPILRRMAP